MRHDRFCLTCPSFCDLNDRMHPPKESEIPNLIYSWIKKTLIDMESGDVLVFFVGDFLSDNFLTRKRMEKLTLGSPEIAQAWHYALQCQETYLITLGHNHLTPQTIHAILKEYHEWRDKYEVTHDVGEKTLDKYKELSNDELTERIAKISRIHVN